MSVVTRHQFLTQLHKLLNPVTYLEIGVQHGTSLNLADPDITFAIGVDPRPLCEPKRNQVLYHQTSKEFFDNLYRDPTFYNDFGPNLNGGPLSVDLAFIDGSHLFEDALHDFKELVEYMSPRGVIVFDDVLPYNQGMAAREQCPGDWTGDVWKVDPWLRHWYPRLPKMLVDTFPTGSLVTWNVAAGTAWEARTPFVDPGNVVPDHVLNREYVATTEEALKVIADWQDGFLVG